MEVQLRQIADLDGALTLAGRIEEYAAAAMADYREGDLPEGIGAQILALHFDAPEHVLVVAESEPGAADLGLCLVGPFEDPLTGERQPFVRLLFVDPSVRHRGLARNLQEEVRAILAERGLQVLAARAPHNDDALISMGERWGFIRQWEYLVHEA
ncbi:MAG: GNAT family N-acetyltransferase [Planctomycetota bacterium]|nr:GNAT family N-acetyltransferase [Planctomycetota bacterium]